MAWDAQRIDWKQQYSRTQPASSPNHALDAMRRFTLSEDSLRVGSARLIESGLALNSGGTPSVLPDRTAESLALFTMKNCPPMISAIEQRRHTIPTPPSPQRSRPQPLTARAHSEPASPYSRAEYRNFVNLSSQFGHPTTVRARRSNSPKELQNLCDSAPRAPSSSGYNARRASGNCTPEHELIESSADVYREVMQLIDGPLR